MPYTYFTHLICSTCGTSYPADRAQTFCSSCRSPLLAQYDLTNAKQILEKEIFWGRPKGMWRWHELLPVSRPDAIVSLGEGDTPLLALPRLGEMFGLANLFIKEESLNPTGSFKARGLATAISKANELGIRQVVIPTAGNAGGAMAAYAARAGMEALIYMPADTPKANIDECQAVGAEVALVEGLISDAAVLAAEKSHHGWFDISTFKEPYRLEGKKIMGYEIAEEFHWFLPDVIIYPTGGGTGLVGMWKAFDELEQLGWVDADRRPRMVAVQAEGCAPLVKAYLAGMEASDFWEGAHTIASGLRVPKSFADRLILRYLHDSHGIALAVSDQAIEEAQGLIGRTEGLFTCPEGAATVAALAQLIDQKWVHKDERVVIFNTAAGNKYPFPPSKSLR
jgi:threonine synthase